MSADGQNPRPGSYYWRPLPGGFEVVVYPLTLGRARLCYGKQHDEGLITSYTYEDPTLAISAAEEWDGKGDPSDGWCRHDSTARRRKDGFVASETVEHIPVLRWSWIPTAEFMARELACLDNPTYSARFRNVRRTGDTELDDPQPVNVLSCEQCNKAWFLVRREADEMIGAAELDLTGWTLL